MDADLHALLGLDDDEDGLGALRDLLIEADLDLIEDLVRIRRENPDLTQEVIAERMSRSKTAVSNFERLGSDPHLSTIRRYAAAIGVVVTHQVQDYEAWKIGRSKFWTGDTPLGQSQARSSSTVVTKKTHGVGLEVDGQRYCAGA